MIGSRKSRNGGEEEEPWELLEMEKGVISLSVTRFYIRQTLWGHIPSLATTTNQTKTKQILILSLSLHLSSPSSTFIQQTTNATAAKEKQKTRQDNHFYINALHFSNTTVQSSIHIIAGQTQTQSEKNEVEEAAQVKCKGIHALGYP
jgi:hypothetical protein